MIGTMVDRLKMSLATLAFVALAACGPAPPCPEQPIFPGWNYTPARPGFVVYFDQTGKRLTPQSMAVLESYVEEVKKARNTVTGTSTAWVYTHHDPLGEGGMVIRRLLMQRGVSPDRIILMLNSDSYYSDPYPPNPTQSRRARLRGPDSTNPLNPKWPPEGYTKTTIRCVATRELLVRDTRP
jgi:hypothetical protein